MSAISFVLLPFIFSISSDEKFTIPLAISFPPLTTLTVLPTSNLPSTAVIPDGNKDLPLKTNAFLAPSSIINFPAMLLANAIHLFLRFNLSDLGQKAVPILSPFINLKSTSFSVDFTMPVIIPLSPAILAASSLVIIPPVPTLLPELPAALFIFSVIECTSVMSFASAFLDGFLSYNPSMSVSITSISASISTATRADNLSLSPNLSSSTDTVSFSFIMGTTSMCKRHSIAFRAYKNLLRSAKSPRVSNT